MFPTLTHTRPRAREYTNKTTKGPHSEFRMNLNTSNPLLLAAITGGGGLGGGTGPGETNPFFGRTTTPGGGLLFRSRNVPPGPGNDDDANGDNVFGGAFAPDGAYGHGGGGYLHPYIGPLPPAGTEKDFVWGFILGFFVGFIMLFWVWMPTVPHKQKIGIISGISFQLALNLLRKSGQAEVVM